MNHLPLNSSVVRALSDGAYCLAHGRELLPPVALEPYCVQCHRLGLPAAIRLAPDGIIANWTCGHTAGWANQKRRIAFPELLHALGWGVRCTKCKENVSGDNGPTDPVFSVGCGCTTRTMANPLGPFVVASVGRPEHV